MSKFWILLQKEVRELLTWQLIAPLLVTLLMFFILGKTLSHAQQQAKTPQALTVLDQDQTVTSRAVTASLSSSFNVHTLSTGDSQAALSDARSRNGKLAVILPPGLEQNIRAGKSTDIPTYSIVENFSLLAGQRYTTLQVALSEVNNALSNQLLRSQLAGMDPAVLKNPLHSNEYTVVGNGQANVPVADIFNYISSQVTYIPIILFFVITFSAQIIATTIASEKENKTLETLLSMPVRRQYIVSAKMLAAGIVAAFASVIYLVGIRSYLNGLSGGNSGSAATQAAAQQLGLVFTPMQYVVLGLVLFLGILTALAIALILGAFAEDVKGVQGLVTPLMVLVLIPYFLVLFLDLSTVPLIGRLAVYAIPFAHPFLAAPNLMLHHYSAVWYGIIYLVLWFALCVGIATKIFTTDQIVTMKLNWGRKRR